MTLRGDIETFSLAAIGGMIHSEKKTGILKVIRREHFARIYFKAGDIVFIDSDLAEDVSLGSLLKTHNLVKNEDIHDALNLSKTNGKRLGIVLVEQGILSQKKLIHILHYQFKEVIAKVLNWNEGAFEYTDGLDDYTEDIHLKIDPIRLVAEAQKWKEYRTLIPSDRVVFRIKGEGTSSAFSSDGLSRVMLLIDGERSVARIIAETGLSRLAVYRALAALVSQGAVTREGLGARSDDLHKGDREATSRCYLILLDKMTRGLSEALGTKKVAFLLQNVVKRAPFGDRLFRDLQPGAGINATLQAMHAQIRHHAEKISWKDFIHLMDQILFNLLQEEYQLLGFRASKSTLRRLMSLVETGKIGPEYVSRGLLRMLSRLSEDEAFLQGTKRLFNTSRTDPTATTEHPVPSSHRFDGLGEEAVIVFYHQVIRMIVNDLKEEVGVKALDLLLNILKGSEYGHILAPFDINADPIATAKHMCELIRTRHQGFDKKNLAHVFPQVLRNLFQEESRLLGEKATRSSIMKVRAHITDPKQNRFKPLADQLVPMLENILSA